MSKFDLNANRQSSNPLTLVVIVVLILVSWQISTFFLPTKGPLDIIGIWLSVTGAQLIELLALVFPLILVCLILSTIAIFLFFRLFVFKKWKKFVLSLNRASNETTHEPHNFKLSGLEVKSLPYVRSKFDSPQASDTFFTSNFDSPHKFVHWIALHNELREASFEVNIDSEIKVRFWVPQNLEENDLDILCSSLQTNSSNLEFEPTPYPAIIGIFGSYPNTVSLRSKYVKFNNECISIIFIKGIPRASFEGTQIDRLIHALLERGLRASFIVNFISSKKIPKDNCGKYTQTVPGLLNGSSVSFNSKENGEETSFGFWETSSYLVVRSTDEDNHLLKVKSAKIILETIFLNPSNPIKTKILKGYQLQLALPKVLRRSSIGKTGLLSSRQLSFLVQFPQEAQPGYVRKYSPIFEIPPQRETDIELFQVLKGDRRLYTAGVDFSHLMTHMVVAGQTGKGKTRFIGNLIQQIKKCKDIGITVFDWKGEYQELLYTVYEIGRESCPLKINLFETHGLDNIEQYVQNLVALFRELLRTETENNLSSQMERILRESLIDYLRHSSGSYEGYEKFLSTWITKNHRRFSNPESSTAGLINRFGTLFRGRLGFVFNTSATTIDFESLLHDQVCFDLSNLAAYNKDDARLFLNVLLMVIRTYLFQSFSNRLRYLVIAEEAQYLVPEVFTKRSTADASPIEDIALFQRAYGAGLIAVTTRPNLISRNILANSGTKIFFQCPLDSNLVGDIINLTPDQRQFLSLMPDRVLIAHLPWFEHPFKGKTISFEFPNPRINKTKGIYEKPASQNDHKLNKEEFSSAHQISYLHPLERHFIDTVCPVLYKQQILHRVCRINSQILIDIPRQQIMILFIENLDQKATLQLPTLSHNVSTIILFCPPLIKTKLQNELIDKFTNYEAPTVTLTKIHLASLTRLEVERVIQNLTKGVLHNYLIQIPMNAQNQVPP